MRNLLLSLAAGLLVAVPATAGTVTAPRVAVTSFDQLAKPLPLPYQDGGDASARVAAARAKAKAAGKLLLIDLGGNWCLDCRILAGTVELPEVARFVKSHFEVVTVDVGRFDRNLQVPAAYGITSRLAGVPAVLIVDPKTNTLVNADKTTALSDARSMTPQAIADWLAHYAR